ncbi:VanZ family protein [Halostella litorea]|uniref:VanZ family protein n=1 Tax=Halostella litorea TaxID=2528831 RepID=UPI00192A3D44|nr:VanZ family protein [Halostella litorea]
MAETELGTEIDRSTVRRLPPRRYRVAAALAVAAVLTVGSLVPTGGSLSISGPLGLLGADKWLHGIAYAGLAGTTAFALVEDVRVDVRLAARTGAGAVAYGVGMELLQAALPYRTFSLADAAANCVGAAVGVALALLVLRAL